MFNVHQNQKRSCRRIPCPHQLAATATLESRNMTDTPPSDDKPAAEVPNNNEEEPLTVKSAIKKSVKATNEALGQLQETSEQISKPVVSRLSTLEKQAMHFAKRSLYMYERRRQYGPEIVLGSGAVLGGLVAARRGRIPGALAGIIAGSVSYLNIYTVDLIDWTPSSGGNKSK